ncbi:16S rRNA (uracil1498-N3)-methyltransferase [Roseimicrobium gellanilyticum]|uniref:Ribosomal RNA small subunit methyltransferase E n=1 Tax=Roseimicrobium gellanilyticum TaxID=748857 RepID=A0A366HD41_9BACT|nr:16S rRNA (uracil(1498)-N(3))-methyltransferase [Roseimicrobium gellanilyticum]RBP39759.1 16S rRNA (uracil1498-N3)-methyltransferase [Roseimicrobium gellanilyticum]
MGLPRFYIPPNQWQPSSLALTADEARHCAQVMRKEAGQEVVVFNGNGAWARTKITSSGKDRVELDLVEWGESSAPAVSITLFQSIPKGSNMDLIIEKSVELGVNAIVPVFSDRTVVRLDAKDAVKKQEKWQRLALEACKQCGQNWLPQVSVPVSFDAAWRQLPAHDLRLIAAIQEDSRSFKDTLAAVRVRKGEEKIQSVLMAIGPEGDFTPKEYAAARGAHGCLPVSLGSIILRVETAAIFCLSVLRHEVGG